MITPEEFDKRLSALDTELAEIKVVLARIEEYLVKSTTIIEGVSAEVKPTLDTLLKHPMAKLFLGGKK